MLAHQRYLSRSVILSSERTSTPSHPRAHRKTSSRESGYLGWESFVIVGLTNPGIPVESEITVPDHLPGGTVHDIV
jgi:hypothetical protein